MALIKTGTTSIQSTFHHNRTELKSQGFIYPGNEVNHHKFYFATDSPKNEWHRMFQNIDEQVLKKQVANFFSSIEKDFLSACSQHIISTENLFISNKRQVKKVIEYLSEFFSKIVVIVFIRNPVNHYSSAQQQGVKARSFIKRPYSWRLPFRKVLHAWEQFVDVKVIEYQKGVDSCEALCQNIGIDYNKLTINQKKSNTSLSIEQMLLLEKIQYHLYSQHENRFKNHLGVIQNVNPSFTTKPELQEWVKPVIYQNHLEDLQWLKEEYGIDFLSEELEKQEITSIPTFKNGKATVRDVYKVPSEETVEKYEAIVVDALLKNLVQNKQN